MGKSSYRLFLSLLKNPKVATTNLYNHFRQDSLYRNSIYLMLSTIVMSILGFAFWMICSRLYSPQQVGYATTIISIATLASMFCILGFNNVNIRFIPVIKDKNRLISTGFLLITIACFIVSTIFFNVIAYTHIINIFTNFSIYTFLLFFIYVLFISINTLFDSIFVAYRSALFLLLKNSLMSIFKLLLPIFLVSLSFWGIINATIIAFFGSLSFGLFILVSKFGYKPQIVLDKNLLKQTKTYALGNFVGNIFGMLPSTFVPVLIAWKEGPSATAFYYMPLMITSVLKIIPSATSQSLFAEASHNESRLNYYLLKSIKGMFLILIIVIFLVFIFANVVLHFFGSQYAMHGSNVLRILAVASMISSINYLGDTISNIKKRVKVYVFMNIFNSLIIVSLVYILVPYGLIWVAFGNLIGQLLTAVVYILVNRNLILSLF